MWSLALFVADSRGIEYLSCNLFECDKNNCLLNPFKQQRVKYLIIAVVMYLGSTVVVTVGGHIQDGARIRFNPRSSKCEMVLTPESDEDVLLSLEIFTIISYVVPVFVVAVSCVLSAALLTQSNEQLQQQARNRATVTILLFALVYGVCNIPIVVEIILLAYSWYTDNMKWYHEMKQFDLQLYYSNAIYTLLLAVNSAATSPQGVYSHSDREDIETGS